MIWPCGWPVCPAPVHLLLEASVLPPLQTHKYTQTYTLVQQTGRGNSTEAWLSAIKNSCMCVWLCVKDRQRHKERIKGVAGKKKYIGGRVCGEQLSHSITRQMFWLCSETYCSAIWTFKCCLLKEIHWQEIRYDLLLLYTVWSFTSSSSSCNHFPLQAALSMSVARCWSWGVMRPNQMGENY